MTTPQLHIEGAVATITLRRPQEANRLGPDDLTALARHIATVNAAGPVLVLQLRAGGKYFCSGFDIGALGAAGAMDFAGVVDALEEARPVTIAVLQGGVYGGATDLAVACDFRLGVPGIDMFMPAARLGLHFYARGLERYVSRLGIDAAKRLFLTGERIAADEMKAIGFLTQLVPADELDDAAAHLTAALAGMAPIALLGMKKHLNRIARGTLNVAELDADVARSMASADLQEGRAAFVEKRAPIFKGR